MDILSCWFCIEIKSGLQEDDTVAYDTSSVSDDYYSDSYSDSIW